MKHISEHFPPGIRVDPAEAKRIAEGAKLNKKALLVIKGEGYSPARIKRWIADNNPEPDMLDAMRRMYRATVAKRTL